MSSDFAGRAFAQIDLDAFANNIEAMRSACSGQSYLPIIKANGYGHGLESIAGALLAHAERVSQFSSALEGCAVAALSEAQRLRDCGWDRPIVLLPGFIDLAELNECRRLGLDPVIHSPYQAALLLAQPEGITRVWLKANTGMNRLGLNAAAWREAYNALTAVPNLDVVAMSHLACADELDSPATTKQREAFDSLLATAGSVRRTLAASGGILAWPQTHYDIVRPGIMLYGSSPFAARSAQSLDLAPVMTLKSRLIAVNNLNAGDAVGYGGTFVADKPMRIGVVSIGYGDGYPRKAPTGTPVLVETATGKRRTTLVGRVSMDMITIDVTDLQVDVGASVVLWGDGLPADDIAQHCQTIAYELFCQVTARVPRQTS
ncbi:MAG: alanine racemase [Proteobacteria bacterium]|nr:alanine racemase [Pseudomonadota bacterium]MDA0895923.1 alanine racemase [Pseudomonadota bacterium]MDA1245116.1 alanine racemase [Pseudomonadota bacterium]